MSIMKQAIKKDPAKYLTIALALDEANRLSVLLTSEYSLSENVQALRHSYCRLLLLGLAGHGSDEL